MHLLARLATRGSAAAARGRTAVAGDGAEAGAVLPTAAPLPTSRLTGVEATPGVRFAGEAVTILFALRTVGRDVFSRPCFVCSILGMTALKANLLAVAENNDQERISVKIASAAHFSGSRTVLACLRWAK